MNFKGRVVILQTHVPGYRVPFFKELRRRLDGAHVVAGNDYFTPVSPNAAVSEKWHTLIENVFLLRNNLLWQKGAIRMCHSADVLVLEWNPRIISSWWLVVSRRLIGRKTLLWGHAKSKSSFAIVPQFVRNTMAEFSAGIIAYTATEAREARRQYPGLPVWAAPNSCVAEADVRDVADGPEMTPQDVIYVGRLIRSKKVFLLIQAWALLVKRVPSGARLVLVGDGPESEDIWRQCVKLGIDSSVLMTGYLGNVRQLEERYRSALMAVSPGYIGLSAIQSMAFGVPMVISRTEKHSPEIEACEEGVNSLFFRTDDSADLARAIMEVYTGHARWTASRRSIAKVIKQRYTFEKMAASYADALTGIAEGDQIRPRVALVWEYYGPYHLARLRDLVARCDRYQIVAVEIAARTISHAWRRGFVDIELHPIEQDRTSSEVNFLVLYRRSVRFLREADIQVVMIPSYWPKHSLAMLLAAKWLGVRTVMMNDSHQLTAHDSALLPFLKRRLVWMYNAALVAGQRHVKYYSLLGMPADRIFDGYDVVDNNFFGTRALTCRTKALELRQTWGLPPAYFLNVGRLVRKKNLPTLVEAFAKLRSRSADFPALVLVGNGPEEPALKAQCVLLGLTVRDMGGAPSSVPLGVRHEDVLFYGFRQEADLPVFYALARAFILPSSSEEWGLVVNEAMASGLPVVVSSEAGCAPDLVKEGVTGLTFDAGNADQLADCLDRLAHDVELADTIGRNAQAWIAEWNLERFSRNAEKAIDTARW